MEKQIGVKKNIMFGLVTVIMVAGIFMIFSHKPVTSKVTSTKASVIKAKQTNKTNKTTKKSYPKAEGDLVLVNKTHPAADDPNLELVNLTDNEQIAKRVKEPYEELANAAKEAGHPLVIVSAYRSKAYQEKIYNEQIETYENQGLSKEEATKKTDDYMMKPGTSEHQTGLAVDVLDETEYKLRPSLSPEFGNTDGGKWLADNAYKYGFIIRYPKDKEDITKIKYEPWHLRYVGKGNAKKIHDQKICLEEYVNEKN